MCRSSLLCPPWLGGTYGQWEVGPPVFVLRHQAGPSEILKRLVRYSPGPRSVQGFHEPARRPFFPAGVFHVTITSRAAPGGRAKPCSSAESWPVVPCLAHQPSTRPISKVLFFHLPHRDSDRGEPCLFCYLASALGAQSVLRSAGPAAGADLPRPPPAVVWQAAGPRGPVIYFLLYFSTARGFRGIGMMANRAAAGLWNDRPRGRPCAALESVVAATRSAAPRPAVRQARRSELRGVDSSGSEFRQSGRRESGSPAGRQRVHQRKAQASFSAVPAPLG